MPVLSPVEGHVLSLSKQPAQRPAASALGATALRSGRRSGSAPGRAPRTVFGSVSAMLEAGLRPPLAALRTLRPCEPSPYVFHQQDPAEGNTGAAWRALGRGRPWPV